MLYLAQCPRQSTKGHCPRGQWAGLHLGYLLEFSRSNRFRRSLLLKPTRGNIIVGTDGWQRGICRRPTLRSAGARTPPFSSGLDCRFRGMTRSDFKTVAPSELHDGFPQARWARMCALVINQQEAFPMQPSSAPSRRPAKPQDAHAGLAQKIRHLAHELYEQRGRVNGKCVR